MAKYKISQIAEYFLKLANKDLDEGITPLKLQKLLYFAQGHYLALHDEPLFDEEIQAWEHGPVVPSIYHEYKNNGSSYIQYSPSNSQEEVNADTQKYLDEIFQLYGQYSAWKLRNMTHETDPWIDAENGTISQEQMKTYFKQFLK